MKYLKYFLLSFIICTCLTSCVATTLAQDDVYSGRVTSVDEITYSTIITFGTPIYYNGIISHYFYNGIYYYPYTYNGIRYFHPFSSPRPRGYIFRYGSSFRPIPRYGHNYVRPQGHYDGYRRSTHVNGNIGHRPTYRESSTRFQHRPNINQSNQRPGFRPNNRGNNHHNRK